MVTDEILFAVDRLTNKFSSDEQKKAGNVIINMLEDFDEDEWQDMSETERDKWISKYL